MNMFQNIPVWLIMTIGFSAQLFFGLRTMLQWLKSEAAHKSVSPVSYWIFSVIGACLMFIYGVIRNDFSIILGQFISSVESERQRHLDKDQVPDQSLHVHPPPGGDSIPAE